VVAADIAREIVGVSTIAGEMLTSSSQVSESSHELSALAEQLRQLVGRFKTEATMPQAVASLAPQKAAPVFSGKAGAVRSART
jgi:methyl-accepting chemotaxis protein